MFIDKVCVLHRQSKWCYFANEVHILFLPIMPVNKKPVKQFTICLTGFLFIGIIGKRSRISYFFQWNMIIDRAL